MNIKINSGFAIVELMISFSILAVFIFALVSITSLLHGENRQSEMKLEVMDLNQSLLRQFSQASLCDCMLVSRQPTPLNLNAAVGGILTLPMLTRGCDPGPWLQTNNLVPETKTNIGISGITLENFIDLGNDTFSAELIVKISGEPRFLKPIRVDQLLKLSPTRDILSCVSSPRDQELTLADFCASIPGATYDGTSQLCTIPPSAPAAASAVSPNSCGPGNTGLQVLNNGTRPQYPRACCNTGISGTWTCLPF